MKSYQMMPNRVSSKQLAQQNAAERRTPTERIVRNKGADGHTTFLECFARVKLSNQFLKSVKIDNSSSWNFTNFHFIYSTLLDFAQLMFVDRSCSVQLKRALCGIGVTVTVSQFSCGIEIQLSLQSSDSNFKIKMCRNQAEFLVSPKQVSFP